MSREIKFRAWSNLFGWAEHMYLDPVAGWSASFIESENPLVRRHQYDITVEQYTGLKDANGVEVYEGDILRQYHFTDCDNNEHYLFHVVRWVARIGGWMAVNRRHPMPEEWGNASGNCLLYSYLKMPETNAVVGNIHDNPELLEEAE